MKKMTVKQQLFFLIFLLTSGAAGAATSGEEFKDFYDLVEGAATGYLGRGLAIAGGLVGLAYGAGQGKAMIAGLGIVLATFGVLGPAIVDQIYNSALV